MKEESEERELEIFLQKFQKPAFQEPSEELDMAFYRLLATEKQAIVITKQPTRLVAFWQNNYLKYAAVFVGLLGAFWVGRITTEPLKIIDTKIVYVPSETIETQKITPEKPIFIAQKSPQQRSVMTQITDLRKEMKAFQENQERMMLSLLKRESASDRLQALNYSYQIEQPDTEVLNALIKTLDEDPNMNVRMAAADAIGQFSNAKVVREGLIKSLMKQQEPSLQMAVIGLLTRVRERRAIPMLQQFAQNENISEQVKQQVEESIRLMSEE